MKSVTIAELIERLEACDGPDWRLDDLVNNTTGQTRVVGGLGLSGRTRGSTRYFGPKSDPFGNGSPVPKPTKTPASREKAIRALKKLQN